MPRTVHDTFTEGANTVLSSHTGEVGATWTQHPSSANTATVIASADRVGNDSTGAAVYYSSWAPGSADYFVSGTIHAITVESDGIAGIGARIDTSANTHYTFVYYVVGGGFQLYGTVAGTPTQLGSTYAFSIVAGQSYHMRLEVYGSSIRCYVNGVERISVTDTSVTGAGRAGVIFNAAAGTATTGILLDDFEAWNGHQLPPYYIAAGSAAFTATNSASISPGLPAGWAAGDLHILGCHHSSNTALGFPAGWAKFSPSGVSDNNTTAQRVELYYRWAEAGDAAPAITAGAITTVRGAQIYGFRRVGGGGNNVSLVEPFSVTSRLNNAASATISTTNITPTHDLTLGVFLGFYEDDPTAGSQPSQGGWSVPARVGSALGTDMAIFSSIRLQYAAGSYATPTTVVSGGTFANSVNVGVLIALRPAASMPPALITNKSIRGLATRRRFY